MQQHFYHPRTGKSAIAELLPAAERLQKMTDAETRAIAAPLLCELESITAPVLAQAAVFQKCATDLIVIGSGGSGLGGLALASTCTASTAQRIHVLDCCDLYAAESLMQALKSEQTALLVISKSGTTVETLAYLDLFAAWLKPLPDVSERIAVITMTDGNALHQFALTRGLAVLAHPADLCGRFSIFSSVGLLPAAFIGMDINALLTGAKRAWQEPDAAVQAAIFQRDALSYGLGVHVTFAYGSRYAALAQWWRQGVAESLGKQGRGFYPISAIGTRDQHSQLQLFLDGAPLAMFTLLTEESAGLGPRLSENTLLPMLQQKYLGDVIQSQQKATVETLKNAGKSIRHLALENHQPETIGRLIMQWTQEIILLGFMLGINPFDQPAIEESKRLSREYL